VRLKTIVIFTLCVAMLHADEGMWPYNQIPRDTIKEKHKFDATPEFVDHLRMSSVRLPGGAGSFVSAQGLILTNQHLVTGCLGDKIKDGFYADSASAELKCAGIDAAVLLGIDDVTAQIASLKTLEQRNAAAGKIEKDCKGADRCQVVKFFSGGRYDLYRYKIYSDVRLVFAPENELAFFGRQRDSITYLRYGLDAAFLRAYENGKPAATPNFLKWSVESIQEGDLVFSSGDPVSTHRSATAAQLQFLRDRELPTQLPRLASRLQSLTTYANQSEANRKAAEPVLTELAGEYKIGAGKLIGLRDDRMIARKTNFEGKVKRAAERDPKIGTKGIEVWDQVANAYKMWQQNERAYELLESHADPGSVLFKVARQLLRGEEPDMRVADEGVETLLLTAYLDEIKNLNDRDAPTRAVVGARSARRDGVDVKGDSPKADKQAARIDVSPGKTLLNGKSSKEVAAEVMKATALKDPAERRKLAGNKEAARKSDDALLHLVAIIEESAQKLRKRHDESIGALETTAAEKIAQYRFKLFGAAEYPDATGTPRMEFGTVKGYTDRAGVLMPFADTFSGLYYRAANDGPYLIPPRWIDSRKAIDEVRPLDFVTTCDIGGGDYGGAVVNRAGELVGVTFDGNLESLPDSFLYTDEQARAVHVAAQGIAEALGKVYHAKGLIDELGIKEPAPVNRSF
jgi:hypothetical protein